MPDGGSVAGWVFDVYRVSDNAYMGTYTSGEDGTIMTDYLVPGEYQFFEQIPEGSLYKEFKTIRNAVIQEAMKIANGIQQAAELEPRQDVWEVGLPSGGEPDVDAMADPSYWMEQFHPRFTEVEPVISEPDPVDMEPEDTPTIRSSDSKEWWSDYYKLARRFLYGTKLEKPDFQKAIPLLLLEANRGNGYACYDLGRMHLLGQGCEEDDEEAQRWFMDALEAFQTAEMAAEKKGYLRYRIGRCHAYGHGTEQNHEESARWFRQAVDENNPFAAYSLGGQYLRGQGVEQSDTEAYNLFYMAATHEKQPNRCHRDQTGGYLCRLSADLRSYP